MICPVVYLNAYLILSVTAKLLAGIVFVSPANGHRTTRKGQMTGTNQHSVFTGSGL